MSFDLLNKAGQDFAEANMGETFSYANVTGFVTTGLLGVFNQVEQAYTMQDFSFRRITTYNLISGKTQWGSVVPADRGTITDSSNGTYQIEHIAGRISQGEPAFEMKLKKLT